MRVVGLSGAQGAGKSTLLKELMARGWQLDQFRVSRAVQEQLGWSTLENVMESWDTMVRFQEEVFKQKFDHDSLLVQAADTDNPSGIILTERTFADIAAYTAQWTWRHVDRGNVPLNDAINFLAGYLTGCSFAQCQVYAGTILLPYMAEVVPWENDLNRAPLSDVDAIMEDIERFMERKVPLDHKKLRVTTKTVGDRATQVETWLKSI